jgi:hypothetical protein
MDGLSGAASIVAIVDISTKIISLCFQYSVAVKDAKPDIKRVQRRVGEMKSVLEKAQHLVDEQGKTRLATAYGLLDSLKPCLQELEEVKTELQPGKTRKAMSRFGVRALKWPFTSKQVDKIISSLEGYQQTFTLALQVDQM